MAETLYSELVYASPGTYRPLVNIQGITSPAPVHPLAEAIAVEAAYEPELDVFLGPAHIDIAHDVFHASSEIALDLLTLDASGSMSRKTVAPLLMRTVADVLLDEPDRAPFLGAYQGYWLARDTIRLDHLTGEFESKAMALRNARHPLFPASMTSPPPRTRSCPGGARPSPTPGARTTVQFRIAAGFRPISRSSSCTS